MEKIYIIEGIHSFLVKKKIKELISQSNLDDLSVIKEDANTYSLDELIQELSTISFFTDTKMVVVENINLFEKYSTDQLKILFDYLKKPQDDIILVFSVVYDNLKSLTDSKTKLLDNIYNYAYLIETKKLSVKDIPNYIKDEFTKEDYQITSKEIDLISASSSDLFIINSEIEKIKTYFIDTKKVTIKELKQLLSDNMENNIYHVTQAILDNDQSTAFRIYQHLANLNYEPLAIIAELSRTVGRIIQAKRLIYQGYDADKLKKYFQMSDNAYYYLDRNTRNYSGQSLNRIIIKLTDLDFQIKAGMIDKKLGLELFILGAI